MDFLVEQKEKTLLRIYAIPGASKNEIVGPYGEPVRLKIKTNAIAEDGKANKEIISFLSKSLKISKTKIEILRGQTSRQKDFLIDESYEITGLKLQALLSAIVTK